MEYPQEIKRCSKCEETKTLSDFYFVPSRGVWSCWCKKCVKERAVLDRKKEGYKEYHREYRRRNHDHVLWLAREARARNPKKSAIYTSDCRAKNPGRALLAQAKARAKKYGIPFSIKIQDIVVPNRCPALGTPFGPNTGRGRGFHSDSLSLDRIEPKLGYVSGNIQVLSGKANKMKGDATKEELLLFARWVLRSYS